MTVSTDLEWVLSCPSLLNVSSQPELLDGAAWLADLREEFNFLNSHVDPDIETPRRLGFYYENLLEYLFNKSSQVSDIKRNIQIKNDKNTLGELDFIGRYSGSAFHLECAVKFYLRVGTGSKLSDFIGPGKADRLDLKYHRIIHHQLPIDAHPMAQTTLASHNLVVHQRVLLMQGYLFHPWEGGCPAELAAEINPDHWQGWWLRQTDVQKLCETDSDLQFMPLQKPFWLAVKGEESFGMAGLRSWLETVTRPVLVSRGDFRGNHWVEKDRGFIVPDHW
ncbi:DUF1853 family protein [Neptuniibacter sp. CAU 1671]|uniref:DUF1853 family protein n=1 Tax=Neptuniibacter sp. CAU 1671 TaxID=3032593 RepID=UPI0023D99188|nr:DUF1853 family protein [Neptuniibacter sp. CAU 1671]MDF2180516.1 DUF1853 family protein [Neptuniibacter sp. CAU 1671]